MRGHCISSLIAFTSFGIARQFRKIVGLGAGGFKHVELIGRRDKATRAAIPKPRKIEGVDIAAGIEGDGRMGGSCQHDRVCIRGRITKLCLRRRPPPVHRTTIEPVTSRRPTRGPFSATSIIVCLRWSNSGRRSSTLHLANRSLILCLNGCQRAPVTTPRGTNASPSRNQRVA